MASGHGGRSKGKSSTSGILGIQVTTLLRVFGRRYGCSIEALKICVKWYRDVWDYLEKYGIPYHPLHDQGYPSIGDVQSTLPVPKDQWFEYGGERSGRFQVSEMSSMFSV